MPITPTDPKDLGQLIFDSNPYVKATGAPPHKKQQEFMFDAVEVDYRSYQWTFKGGSSYIQKALRIPYCYIDDDGIEIRDYLLVGFEGGGGN